MVLNYSTDIHDDNNNWKILHFKYYFPTAHSVEFVGKFEFFNGAALVTLWTLVYCLFRFVNFFLFFKSMLWYELKSGYDRNLLCGYLRQVECVGRCLRAEASCAWTAVCCTELTAGHFAFMGVEGASVQNSNVMIISNWAVMCSC